LADRAADPVCKKFQDAFGRSDRGHRREHEGVGLDEPGARRRRRWGYSCHARILAARQLGIGEIPVMVAKGWSEAQKRAYVIADNQLSITGSGWDPELLRLELGELKLSGFDLALTGFGELELGDILADRTEGLTDPDEAPAAPDHPVSQPGDLWMMGRHRLLCGDSTVATDVERVLGGAEPHLMVTDPPYGVEYDPNWRNEAARTSVGMGNRAIGAGAVGKVLNDDKADWTSAWVLFPGDVAYIWHGALHAGVVAQSLAAAKPARSMSTAMPPITGSSPGRLGQGFICSKSGKETPKILAASPPAPARFFCGWSAPRGTPMTYVPDWV
jgi:hypothetical protein